ncbi:MAG: Holliday junction resolvase Hjc [Nanoarchaeota archaeon]
MNRKAKGINAERELIHLFWNAGWAAFRCAASGAIKYPVPDLIAGNNIRKIAIEAKVTGSTRQYFDVEEIDDLLEFSRRFGSEAWLAVKFFREGFYFIHPEDLDKTEAKFGISLEKAKRKGFRFEELVKG